MIFNKNDIKYELKEIELIKDSHYGEDNKYSLCLKYSAYDAKGNKFDVTVPSLNLGTLIPKYLEPGIWSTKLEMSDSRTYNIHNGSNANFIINQIEYATKEMTIEEIEEKLGHKIKIVSKE